MRSLLLILLLLGDWLMAQAYYSAFTVQTGQVSGTQTNFPVLLKPTDNRFKTTGNGGHVAGSGGYDLRPYSDSGLTSALTYELVPGTYSATTGTFEMWVKVPSLADGYVIYLGYGDAALTSDGSSNTTWDSNFKYVGHLGPGSGTLSVADSSQSATSSSNSGATAVTGKVDGGANLVGTHGLLTPYISLSNTINPIAITYSCWIRATTLSGGDSYYQTLCRQTGSQYSEMGVEDTGKSFYVVLASGSVAIDPGSATLSTGVWYLQSMTYDSSGGLKAYINGSSDGTAAANGNLNTTTANLEFGRNPFAGANYETWDGDVDEIRISDTVRAGSWITTEYNNQSAPGTFYTIGTETAVGGGPVIPVFMAQYRQRWN